MQVGKLDCYGDAYINWYMNRDKNYNLFILEKQFLFHLLENKEDSVKNDYFAPLSVSCENNNGLLNRTVNINFSRIILTMAIENTLKLNF